VETRGAGGGGGAEDFGGFPFHFFFFAADVGDYVVEDIETWYTGVSFAQSVGSTYWEYLLLRWLAL
jgi:hypothetical protein